MIPSKNINALKLTPEQVAIYKDLEYREKVLYSALARCGVIQSAIPKIIAKSDLYRVDTNNLEVLEADIKATYSGFIINKRGAENE